MDAITRALAFYLKPGGSLLVADMKAEADNRELIPESHHHVVPHTHGISEARLRATFEGAGLGQFVMKDQGSETIHVPGPEGKKEMTYTWFIARGVKPV